MAKPAVWRPRDWVRIEDAYLRILEQVGPVHALGDLLDALRDSDRPLVSAMRAHSQDLIPNFEILKPLFWSSEQISLHAISPDKISISVWDGTLSVRPPSGQQCAFYVRRRDLDRLWPPAAGTASPTDEAPALPRRTWVHDWFTICGEIASRCVDPKTGRVSIPRSQSALADTVIEWCKDTNRAKPSKTDMREAVRLVCERLRLAQK
jgi:hypothetical protein